MMYAIPLSKAQQRVVRHLNSGGLIDSNSPDKRFRQVTLNWLMDRKIVELDERGIFHSTKLGKTLDDTGWVDPILNDKKFGAAMVKEKDEIRTEIVNENWEPNLQYTGLDVNTSLMFEIDKRYRKRHENSRSDWKIQQQWKETSTSSIKKSSNVSLSLTKEEAEYLQWLLEDTNNPVGQSIVKKLFCP